MVKVRSKFSKKFRYCEKASQFWNLVMSKQNRRFFQFFSLFRIIELQKKLYCKMLFVRLLGVRSGGCLRFASAREKYDNYPNGIKKCIFWGGSMYFWVHIFDHCTSYYYFFPFRERQSPKEMTKKTNSTVTITTSVASSGR